MLQPLQRQLAPAVQWPTQRVEVGRDHNAAQGKPGERRRRACLTHVASVSPANPSWQPRRARTGASRPGRCDKPHGEVRAESSSIESVSVCFWAKKPHTNWALRSEGHPYGPGRRCRNPAAARTDNGSNRDCAPAAQANWSGGVAAECAEFRAILFDVKRD